MKEIYLQLNQNNRKSEDSTTIIIKTLHYQSTQVLLCRIVNLVQADFISNLMAGKWYYYVYILVTNANDLPALDGDTLSRLFAANIETHVLHSIPGYNSGNLHISTSFYVH